MSFLLRTSRTATHICRSYRITLQQQPIQPRYASTVILDSSNICQITEKEKEITGQVNPVKGGPTAQAQKHVGEQLNSQNIADITKGEKKITGQDQPVKDGPTSKVQSILSQDRGRGRDVDIGSSSSSTTTSNQAVNASTSASTSGSSSASGVLDSATISKITDAEKKITGSDGPVKGGPTAQAQKHAGEPISSEALSDITAGEKEIAGDRLKGGPTSVAQSELGKSRNQS
jgi:hypothetical protein